ncbi:MAG: Sugar phosphate isomerase/epimerase [Aeromicrobium sp.]|nr:Sugar phosphate isomerase/epimerase [Aeromicrobium sp.]
MRPAIDSFCYHRHFGAAYPGLETAPAHRWEVSDFVSAAQHHGAEGISIEHFMLEDRSHAALSALRDQIDEAGLSLVWAWGHPDGLGSGFLPEALDDLIAELDVAVRLGADTMRICAGGRRTRPASWAEHRRNLVPLLRAATDAAARRGVTLAVENHADLLGAEVLELLAAVDDPHLGVCLDTGNNLRLLEDVMTVIEDLAPHARAVHLKDVTAYRGDPRAFAFWPSVPLGQGLVDIPRALRALDAVGYTGLLALEIDYLKPEYLDADGNEHQAIASSMSYLRHALTDLRRP